MGDVIDFPRIYQGPPKTPKEVEVNLEGLKESFVEEIAEYISSIVCQQLCNAGFPIDVEHLHKDCSLIYEALRSLMLHHYSVEHPLQQFSDIIFNTNNRIIISQLDKAGNQITDNIELITQQD